MPDFRDVDPRELRLPPSRPQADPGKLQLQIARFGRSAAGMPPPWVYESSDGVLLLYNGVTPSHSDRQIVTRRLDPSRGDRQDPPNVCGISEDRRRTAM